MTLTESQILCNLRVYSVLRRKELANDHRSYVHRRDAVAAWTAAKQEFSWNFEPLDYSDFEDEDQG